MFPYHPSILGLVTSKNDNRKEHITWHTEVIPVLDRELYLDKLVQILREWLKQFLLQVLLYQWWHFLQFHLAWYLGSNSPLLSFCCLDSWFWSAAPQWALPTSQRSLSSHLLPSQTQAPRALSAARPLAALRYLLSGGSSSSTSTSSSQNTAAARAPPSLLSIQAHAGCSLELSCGLLMGNTFMSRSRETCGVPGYSCVAAFAPFPWLFRGGPLPQLDSII